MPHTGRLQAGTDLSVALRPNALRPGEIRPVAQPVNQFEATQDPSATKLGQLANALSELSPAIARYGLVKDKQQSAEDKAKAEMAVNDAMQKGAKSYADMVRSGAIPANASPVYRLYAKQQAGQTLASRMVSDFQQSAVRDLQDTTDIEAYDKYAQSFQDRWMKDNAAGVSGDTAFRSGFDGVATGMMQNMRLQFSAISGKKLEVATKANLTQNIATAIRMGRSLGETEDTIVARANQAADAARAAGMSATAVNEAVGEGLVTYAETEHDMKALALAAKVKAGTGTLENTATFSERRKQAEGHILDTMRANDMEARNAKKEAEDKERSDVLTTGLQLLQDTPNANLKPLVDRLVALKDFSAIEALQNMKERAIKRQWEGDPAAEADAFIRASNPSGPEITVGEVLRGVGKGLYSIEKGNQLRGIIEAQTNARTGATETSYAERARGVLSDPNYKLGKAKITDLMTTIYGVSDNPSRAYAEQDYYNAMVDISQNAEYAKNKYSPASRAMAQAAADDIAEKWSRTSQIAKMDQTKELGAQRELAARIVRETQNGGTISAETKAEMVRRKLTDRASIITFLKANNQQPPAPTPSAPAPSATKPPSKPKPTAAPTIKMAPVTVTAPTPAPLEEEIVEPPMLAPSRRKKPKAKK